MLNKRGFLALLNWVERTDFWSKNERKRREKGEGRASRKGRKCREKERRKWKAGSPSQCPRPLGSVLCGAVGRPGFLPAGSGALLSLQLSLDFSLQGAFGRRCGPSPGSSHCLQALPLQPSTASPAHLVLRPSLTLGGTSSWSLPRAGLA